VPAEITPHGTFDGTTWTLDGAGESDHDFALHGFSVDTVTFHAVIGPNTHTFSGGASLHVLVGYPANVVEIAVTFGFDGSAYDATGTATATAITIGGLVYIGSGQVDAALHGNFATGVLSGEVTFTAATVVLLP